MTARVLHAVLHLLDRQILDHDGRMVAKVDDLEIDLTREPPVLTAILTGPQAWGPRLPGLLGRFVVAVHRRLHEDVDPRPTRIPASQIIEVTSAVHITSAPDTQGFERWVDEQFIRRIPGAGDASE